MRDLLEEKFFPFVVKPGRYAGGEIGQIVKDRSGRFAYLHAYPDKYELGQSYPGLQILYHRVNSDDRFLCERVFAIDHDAEDLMRKLEIPLFSLESSRPAREFDAFGFTLVDETVYTNMLSMLDLSGIPLRSEHRTNEHPIILVGGPAVFNPEPIADFIDVAFIGSCTNGRMSDLREAARVAKGRKVNPRVKALVVPGSQAVAMQAAAEGLPAIFTAAGFEWREAGCSMCLAMNPDKLKGDQVSASSSNRNFKGRQGSPSGRTLLMSPAMVAAAAIAGAVDDVRDYLKEGK